ncbi:hypothetical protein [Amycolatopsis sp. NPDC051903]|uniref:hypothetical protein n=1 Tax=Amycolatopsis sp. NPDC051903 TaxID=3363936 RepID=UPI0037BD1518
MRAPRRPVLVPVGAALLAAPEGHAWEADQLSRAADVPPPAVRVVLDRLAQWGWLAEAEGRYQLTDEGRAELIRVVGRSGTGG